MEPNVKLNAVTAILAAYLTNNHVQPDQMQSLFDTVSKGVDSITNPAPAVAVEAETPKADKAAIRKSLSSDYITSFVDGRRYKSLKRHLTTNGMTPDEYRAKFGLPKDYPMVAPNYSAQRSALAKTLGLGRKPGSTAGAAAPTEDAPAAAEASAPAAKRTRGPNKAKAGDATPAKRTRGKAKGGEAEAAAA